MKRVLVLLLSMGVSTSCGPTEAIEAGGNETHTVDGEPSQSTSVSGLEINQTCLAQASGVAAVGVVITGIGATASCAGLLAVTGPGEVLCLAPAAGTALAAMVASLSGAGAYLACASSSAGDRQVPIVRTESCKVGSGRFCRNVTAKYKNYCGQDVFADTSQISCAKIGLIPATANVARCTEALKRIELATGCLVGRRMMQGYVRNGLCPGSNSDPDSSSHEPPIRAANDKLAMCKSLFTKAGCQNILDRNGTGRGSAETIQNQTSKDFARNVFLCQ
jgi:hypothetical protein